MIDRTECKFGNKFIYRNPKYPHTVLHCLFVKENSSNNLMVVFPNGNEAWVDPNDLSRAKWVCEQSDAQNMDVKWNVWKCSECLMRRQAGWEYTVSGHKPDDKTCPNCGIAIE